MTDRWAAWPLVCLLALSGLSCKGRPKSAQVRIGRNSWQVEIAADDATRQRGLAKRTEVPAGTGMLFVFAREEVLSFHMLDCLVPLDIAFISSDRRIVWIREMLVEVDPAHPTGVYVSGPDERPVQPAPLGLGEGRGTHLALDLAPLGVELIEARGDRRGLLRVVAAQQPRAQVRLADTPPGIDPRPHHEPQVMRAWRRIQPRHVAKRHQPGPVAPGHHDQPLADQRAVGPDQGGDCAAVSDLT
ncbi:hypothetical protein LCGC14_2487940 [marine sediment metagenome]|uniref:DUF192 domain-containing protein n=1 Tax=marine sediment metagenome TaxID=412755 RepID=A0A0F9B5P5_9ZZZZ